MPEHLPRVLQKWIGITGYALRPLAAESGVDRGLISKATRGLRIPSTRTLQRLAATLCEGSEREYATICAELAAAAELDSRPPLNELRAGEVASPP